MKRRIKHNDLLPWFLEDHGQLSDAYIQKTQKFFDWLKESSNKPQAASAKLLPQSNAKKKIERL